MARRKGDDLFTLLAELPWWTSMLVGGVVYLALKYWVEGFAANNMFLAAIAKGLQANAGLFASLFLIPAAVSFFKSVHRRKLLDRQSGLDSIRAMSWREFEMLCGEAFRRKGYAVEENGLGGADGGIDLILKMRGETTLVQCKRWKTFKVGVKELRELFGIVTAEHADRGIFVTSGSFTAEARYFAKDKPLDLLDGHALLDLVRTVQRHSPEHQSYWRNPAPQALAPSLLAAAAQDSAVTAAPSCPRCGNPMVLRTAKRGGNAGDRFWGCSNFPKCRGTLQSV